MFVDFYKLREQPFSDTPDPRFLYLSLTHREALASLCYGIHAGRGFLALIAEPGMGKTTLLFQLLEHLRSSARTAFLFQTQCDSRELLSYLLADLGIDSQEKDLARMHDQLKRVLISEARVGKRVVVFIDEAHNLSDSALETVRLLSDFETPRSKLMQIVLAGQPQLADKLARPTLAQLRQRISILSRLRPFTPAETDAYVNHRLQVAGHEGSQLFTPEARAMIATWSEGIPRKINNLCFSALSLGYALGEKVIDSSLMIEVANDLEISPLGSEQHDGAFPAQAQPERVTVSQAVEQASSMSKASQSTILIPELAKPGSAVDLQPRGSAPVEEVDVFSCDAEVSATDSLPAATISHAASDAGPGQKWVRALSLAGQQLPAMPTASQSAVRVAEPASSSAVIEPPKQDLKAFVAELLAEAAPRSAALPKTVAASPPSPAAMCTKAEPIDARVIQTPGNRHARSRQLLDIEVSPVQALGENLPLSSVPDFLGSRLKQASRTIRLVEAVVVVLFVFGAAGIFFLHRGIARSAPTQTNPAPISSPLSTVSNRAQDVLYASHPDPVVSQRPIVAQTKSHLVQQAQDLDVNVRASQPTTQDSAAGRPALVGKIPNGELVPSFTAGLHPSATVGGEDAPPDLTAVASDAPADALLGVLPPGSDILPVPPLTLEQTAPMPVGGRLKDPQLVSRIPPVYPPAARRTGVEGKVVIHAVIDTAGNVTDPTVVSGPPLLRYAALDSVRKWKYQPAYLNDKSVTSEVFITVEFRLLH
jgi:TonB family protein